MAYYVLGPGGAKHGPAEIHTLNEWVAQGRIAPDTLLEDIGSGVKFPARAIKGISFGAAILQNPTAPAAISSSTPLGRPADPPIAQHLQSNYIRPGLGTGGSNRNLFLPNVNSKWALHGFLSAGGGLFFGVLSGVIAQHLHFHFGRFTVLALGLCIYGGQCGYKGINQGESRRGWLVVGVNVIAFIAVLGLLVWGFMSW